MFYNNDFERYSQHEQKITQFQIILLCNQKIIKSLYSIVRKSLEIDLKTSKLSYEKHETHSNFWFRQNF